ncbi:MAG: PilZ domain-containing protein [Myxococcota bacterium]
MPEVKRQHPRVRPKKIIVRVANQASMKNNYLRDLSQGGLYVRTDKPLPEGEEVALELIPPGWEQALVLTGRVVRSGVETDSEMSRGPGMAVRFENLSPPTAERLAELLREYTETSSAVETDDIIRLRTQLKGVLLELDHCREQLRSRDLSLEDAQRQLAALRTQDSSNVDSTETADLRRQVETLRLELAEARGALEAVQAQVAVVEQDEADSRQLAEQLATKLAAVEASVKKEASLHKEAQSSLAELRMQLSEAQATLEREKETSAALASEFQEAQRVIQQLRAQLSQKEHLDTEQFQVEKERGARLERQLLEAKDQLERSRAKERDLRRLLSLVSKKTDDDVVMVADEGQNEQEEEEPLPEAPSDPDPAGAEPEQESAQEISASEESIDIDIDPAPEAEGEPPPSAPPPEPSAFEEAFDDLPVPAQRSEPVVALSYEQFAQLVKAGAQLVLTPKFHLSMPTETNEMLVSSWLETNNTLVQIVRAARGRLAADDILQVLHRLSGRKLIEVRGAAE